jgi:hypothetical protein
MMVASTTSFRPWGGVTGGSARGCGGVPGWVAGLASVKRVKSKCASNTAAEQHGCAEGRSRVACATTQGAAIGKRTCMHAAGVKVVRLSSSTTGTDRHVTRVVTPGTGCHQGCHPPSVTWPPSPRGSPSS